MSELTEDQREQLVALTTEWHLKAERVRMLQYINTASDGETRLKQAVECELASTEERLARLRLERAKDAIIASPPPQPEAER